MKLETWPWMAGRGADTYRVTLVVEDDDRAGFATADQDFEVVVYAFGGLRSPIEAPPTVNTARGGQAIRVKSSLGDDQGLDIFDPGRPSSRTVSRESGASVHEIEETSTAGASRLGYDVASDEYVYMWQTERAWAGTCRRLSLGLANDTPHTAEFKFRQGGTG